MRVEKADDGKKTPDLFCVRLFASDSPVANDTSDYPNPCHHPARWTARARCLGQYKEA